MTTPLPVEKRRKAQEVTTNGIVKAGNLFLITCMFISNYVCNSGGLKNLKLPITKACPQKESLVCPRPELLKNRSNTGMHSNRGANGQNVQGKGSMGWKIVSFEISMIIGDTLLMVG